MRCLFDGSYEAKMALQRFVEKQMKPGDRVTILVAGAGTGATQCFSFDCLINLQPNDQPQRQVFHTARFVGAMGKRDTPS